MNSSKPTEARNPASTALDTMSALEIAGLMNREDTLVVNAVAAALPEIARAAEIASAAITSGRRLFYAGAGTSGRLGVLDAAECPPTFGVTPGTVVGLIAGGRAAVSGSVEGAEDRREQGGNDLATEGFSAGDVLIGVSASGSTPYVLGALGRAKELGGRAIGLTCNPETPLHSLAEFTITILVGPEVLTGSTRLKAGTAQKMALNMISTAAMVLAGKTYGNLMVDLRATNAKLQRRSIGIIRELTGVDEASGVLALRRANGSVKVALLCLLAGVEPPQAEKLLDDAGGSLRRALGG